jgi:hypothetical protein
MPVARNPSYFSGSRTIPGRTSRFARRHYSVPAGGADALLQKAVFHRHHEMRRCMLDVCERDECITTGARLLRAIGEASRHGSALSPSLAGLPTRKARRFPPALRRAAQTSPPRWTPMKRLRSMATLATLALLFPQAIAPNVPLFPPRTTRSSAAARSRAAPLLSKKRSRACAPWLGPSRPRWSGTWVVVASWWSSTTTASRAQRGLSSSGASRATQRRPLRVWWEQPRSAASTRPIPIPAARHPGLQGTTSA